MRKYKVCVPFILMLLLLSACSPSAQTQEVTVKLSEIEVLPDNLEGSLLCSVTYTPGEELSATVRNDTEFWLGAGTGTGALYRQGQDGLWEIAARPAGPIADDLVYTHPGETEGDVFYVAGFNQPELEAGKYKLVFDVSLKGEGPNNNWDFKLEIPFSVA